MGVNVSSNIAGAVTIALIVTALCAEASAQSERPPWDTGGWLPPPPWDAHPPRPRDNRPKVPMVCEKWRDFEYIEHTHEFVRWRGRPYKVCMPEDHWTSSSWPQTGRPEHEHGKGKPVPNTRKNRCRHCQSVADTCSARAKRGVELCKEKLQDYWHTQCRTEWRDYSGKKAGRIVHKGCMDPKMLYGWFKAFCRHWVRDCVEGFMDDHPSEKWNVGYTNKIPASMFGGEMGVNYEVQSGGRKGGRKSCQDAGEEAAGSCASKHTECEYDYAGGCDR